MNRRYPSRLGLFRLLAAASLGLLAALSQAAEPVRIGIPLGLSGSNSVIAPAILQSSELAAAEINASGGILGRPVVLEVADDATSVIGAQKAYDALVFQKKVDAIITMEISAARNAGLPIINRGRVPYIYTSFYEGHACNRWMHINGWVPEQQVATIVDYFTDELNGKTFFLVGNDYNFGRNMFDYTRAYIQQKGGTVVGEEYLPLDGTDWTAIVAKVRAAAPDALLTATAGGSANVGLAKQVRAAGLNLHYGSLSLDEGTAKSMGDAASGIYLSASYLTSIDNPQNQRFLAALKEKFGADYQTQSDLSEPQYEAIHLYKAAVEKAGSFDSAKVVAALSEVTFDGPRGPVKMDRQRHAALTMRLAQVQADGSLSTIKTFENLDPGEQCPKL